MLAGLAACGAITATNPVDVATRRSPGGEVQGTGGGPRWAFDGGRRSLFFLIRTQIPKWVAFDVGVDLGPRKRSAYACG